METKPHTYRVYGGKLERSDVTGGGEGSQKLQQPLEYDEDDFWIFTIFSIGW